jgi:hypothetical protein
MPPYVTVCYLKSEAESSNVGVRYDNVYFDRRSSLKPAAWNLVPRFLDAEESIIVNLLVLLGAGSQLVIILKM